MFASTRWRYLTNAIIQGKLRFNKGATIDLVNSDGTISTIDLTELAAIDSIAAADLAKIDGITNGTGAAGKAVVLDSGEDFTWPATGVLTYGVLNDGTTQLAATALELNRTCDVSGRLVAGGATLTITQALHDGKTVLWDQAAGSVFTLPAATGTGARFRFVVSVTATSNSHILQCVGTDEFAGSLTSVDVDTADATLAWAAEAADDYDTITFNRTTTGLAAVGDWVEVEDIVSGSWAVTGVYRASGTVATPFSSAV